EYAFEDHADETAEEEPAQRKADVRRDAVETGAVADRQHPGDAAVVDARLGGKEDADDDHRDDAADGTDRASDGGRQPADRSQKLAAEVGRLACRHQAERGG